MVERTDRARDRHVNPRIATHLEPDLLAALDAYCRSQEVPPGRSDVVRAALREWLRQKGLWPREEE